MPINQRYAYRQNKKAPSDDDEKLLKMSSFVWRQPDKDEKHPQLLRELHCIMTTTTTMATYRSIMTGSDGVSLRLPQLFLSQQRLQEN